MEIISNPTQVEIKKAAQALKDGHLIAFPTETVYGLGADATNEKAVSRVYSVKARPTDHPLIVHISSINQLSKWAVDIPEYALKLGKVFWPGPMSLILKRSYLASDFITGGQSTIAVRIPSHPIALSLLNEFKEIGGLGIAAPSANIFGAVSPTNALSVYEELGRNLQNTDVIIDGGICDFGIESTIVDCTSNSPRILRYGIVTVEDICNVVEVAAFIPKNEFIKTSGNFKSHYSPNAQVVTNRTPGTGEALIARAKIPTPDGVIRLCSPVNKNEFAKQLYTAFRAADNLGIKKIVVILPSEKGIGKAIIDRVLKASHRFEIH